MSKTCQKCGTINPPQATFCQNCAAQLTQDPPQWDKGGGSGQNTVQAATQRPLIAMILAIAAFFCCGPLLGIPAAILGWLELSAIKEGRSPASGKTMASIGLWGGIASTVIHAGLWLIWMLLGAASSVGQYGY